MEKIGTIYGMLTIIKSAESLLWTGKKRRAWLCKCECECRKELVVSGKHLRTGHTQSCGCRREEVTRELHTLDITGERHGRLVALRRLPDEEQKLNGAGFARGIWEWQCDCGNVTTADIASVRAGNTKSCGCLARAKAALNFHNEGHLAYAEDPEYADRKSFIYLVEVSNQYDKIGIAFDLKDRFYKGEISEVWWTKTMNRADCWAVEQAALKATLDYTARDIPKDLCRGGTTEFRSGMVIEETIQLLEEMCEEVQQMGWRSFYDKFVLD